MADRILAFAHTFQSAATGTGNGTAMDVGGLAVATLQVEGITTATVLFEGTIDGSTWYAIRAINLNSGAVASQATADGVWTVPVAGLDQLRARISAYTSGTITVSGKGVVNSSGMQLTV